MDSIRSITNDSLCEAVSDALRRHVGPGKFYSYDRAADAMCVERRTMQSWVLGETAPYGDKLVRLCRWLGPDFANEVLGLAGLHTLPVEQPQGCDFVLNQSLAELLSKLAWAFSDDGRVDHQERPTVIADARVTYARLGAWLSAHDPNVRAPLRAVVVPE